MRLKDDSLVLSGWVCPYCGAATQLVDDSKVYGKSYGGKCYLCEPCAAWVGCYKGTDKALGRLADKRLRVLKERAHEVFDRIWKTGLMSRSEAYQALSYGFDLPPEQTHIGMFDEELCKKTIEGSILILNLFKS